MTIQEQLAWDDVGDESLSFLAALGVDYMTIYPTPESLSDGQDRLADWVRFRDMVAEHGMVLRNAASRGWDALTLGLEDREQKIDAWCMLLRNLGEAGIPTLGYNFKPIGNFRTTSARGRGGVHYSTFNYDEWAGREEYVPDKVISEEALFENLCTFLERVMPVAEEAGVTMALHPDDPPIPEPMAGAARIVSSIEHYRRIFEAVPSERNAMLFCQGCVAEMGVDVEAAIREIASRDKIVYVHFRNIIGTPRDFREVFVDEGQVDMQSAMRTYRDAGFEGPYMMDHTPRFDQPGSELCGRAFAVGYIRSCIDQVYGPRQGIG